MVGSTREQNGHWKSENWTMVTLAVFGPFSGELPTGTLYCALGSGCAGCGCGGLLSATAAPVLAFCVSAA